VLASQPDDESGDDGRFDRCRTSGCGSFHDAPLDFESPNTPGQLAMVQRNPPRATRSISITVR
jgi:hypothetical protein